MNNNIFNMLQGLMQNPVQTLMSANLNIPGNIANNPQARGCSDEPRGDIRPAYRAHA